MEISKDERELYDRQIRLWGLEGQSRLRNARILVLGFEAVAVEVVKNLCLAGVGSLVLQSSREAEANDLSYNFFLEQGSVGTNAAVASAIAVQRLNPRVSVVTETRPLQDLDKKFIASHDVVVVTQTEDVAKLKEIDLEARESECAFFYCLLNGWGGFLFIDLGAKPHEFVVERELPEKESSSTVVGRTSPTQEVIGVSKPERSAGSNTEKISVRETYNSFENAVSVSAEFGQSMKVRHRNKVSPYLPAFLALLDNPEEFNETSILRKTEELGLPKSIIAPEFVKLVTSTRGIQLSSMASIMGGTLSQEVINFLTLREYPIQNVNIYDGLEGKGPIYHLSSI